MRVLGYLLCLLAVVSASRISYEGHTVFRLHPNLEDKQLGHLNFLDYLKTFDRENIIFWNGPDMQIAPQFKDYFVSLLGRNHMNYSVMIPNVQTLITAEESYSQSVRDLEQKFPLSTGATDPFFNDYRTWDEINQWLDNIALQYPTLVQLVALNQSYEGRTIRVMKVTAPSNKGTRKTIVWEGGIHAREWITHASMCYMISKMVTLYGVDSATTDMLNTFEVHIVPVVNPDGYVYTWTTDRMWRKTRSKNPGSPCIGTDPNRNWDDHWCEVGASHVACSDDYCGSKAFSEAEVWTMANYVAVTNQKQIVLEFIDYHSYGQLYMAPYGWSASPPPDATAQANLGNAAVAALNSVNNYIYQYGQIYTIIYPASGSSADWGYDVAKVKYCYGIELRDTGEYGFLLPASQIVPQGEEVYASLLSTASYFKTNN